MPSFSLSRRALAGLGLALPSVARSQGAWPDRPVRLLVPYGAGGAVDTLSRTVAAHFSALANGQPLVVENRAGAGGAIAGAATASARPDGVTIMMADCGANCIGKELQPSLPYDPMTAFAPICHLVNLPLALIVRPGFEPQTVAQLIDLAKRRSDPIPYASPGVGHPSHLGVELLARMAGVRFVAVHYRSGADVMRSLIQGECEFSLPSVSTSMPFLRDNRVRAIAVGAARRVPSMPDVPTIAETLPGFEATTWHGIVAPAGVAPDMVATANRIFNAVIANAEVRGTLERVQAAEVIGGTPQDFAAFIRREYDKWTPIIREGGIRAE